MKLVKTLFLALTLTLVMPNLASASNHYNGFDIMGDVGLRFVGFIGTVVGTGLYIGMSPFTAISHAVPPHNSFQKLADVMVVGPARYTFVRPIGNLSYDNF